MAGTSKYEWPDDEKLQALLDEHGTVETARQVGCPPSSLSRRIRKRGLRRTKQRRTPNPINGNRSPNPGKADGNPDAVSGNRKPDAENANGNRDAAETRKESVREGSEPEGADKPIWDLIRERSQAIRSSLTEQKPKPRSESQEPREHPDSADYPARANPGNPATFEPGADTASAKRASRPERAGVLLRRLPPPIWRSLAVLVLAAVAAIAAFISVRNDPTTYQRETSFAIRPSSDVPPAAVNDVLGTLAQPDSAITETIVNMLGSPRLRDFAAQSAGVPTTSVGGSGAEYVWSATRRTGSTIVDVRLTGPDDAKLLAMQSAAGPEAARLVEASYPPYRLETLSAPSLPEQVGPKVARTVGLALLLGALVGITLVLAERRLRSSVADRDGPSRAPASRGEYWER